MTVSEFNRFVERGNVDWRPLSIAHSMDSFLFNEIFMLLPHQVFQVLMIAPGLIMVEGSLAILRSGPGIPARRARRSAVYAARVLAETTPAIRPAVRTLVLSTPDQMSSSVL